MSRLELEADWKQSQPVINWKNGIKYNSHKNKLSIKTEEAIHNCMPLFLEYTKKTPLELIEEAKNGKETVKARLFDFCNWLQDVKGKKFNHAIHYSYAMIRGFYSHNDINTQKIKAPKVQPAKVEFTDDRVPLMDLVDVTGSTGIVEQKQVLRRNFLKSFYSCLSLRDALIARCIKDSGLDTSDVLDLPLDLIRYQDSSHKRIFIRDLRNKSGEYVCTFFTKETTKDVLMYAKQNRTDAPDGAPIFAETIKEFKSRFRKENHRRYDQNLDEVELRGLNSHHLSTSFRRATVKLEKLLSTRNNIVRILQSSQQSPLRPKRFRKVFSDMCDEMGITQDIKRVFMGKSDPSNKTYEGKSRQNLERYYQKLDAALSIEEVIEPKSSTDIAKLQHQIDNLLAADKRKEDMAVAAILEMKKEIAELKKSKN